MHPEGKPRLQPAQVYAVQNQMMPPRHDAGRELCPSNRMDLARRDGSPRRIVAWPHEEGAFFRIDLSIFELCIRATGRECSSGLNWRGGFSAPNCAYMMAMSGSSRSLSRIERCCKTNAFPGSNDSTRSKTVRRISGDAMRRDEFLLSIQLIEDTLVFAETWIKVRQ